MANGKVRKLLQAISIKLTKFDADTIVLLRRMHSARIPARTLDDEFSSWLAMAKHVEADVVRLWDSLAELDPKVARKIYCFGDSKEAKRNVREFISAVTTRHVFVESLTAVRREIASR